MKVEQTRSHFSVVVPEFSDSQTICRAAVDEEMDDKAKFEGEEHGFYEGASKTERPHDPWLTGLLPYCWAEPQQHRVTAGPAVQTAGGTLAAR